MTEQKSRSRRILRCLLFSVLFFAIAGMAIDRTRTTSSTRPQPSPAASQIKKGEHQDDSVILAPAKDLLLRLDGEHKADALSRFVEGISLEENGEMDKALSAYRKVLDVDPGQADLASRVAALLTRQDDFPQAIDVLKDAIKTNPNAAGPLLQLAFIYAKYLRRTDQALDYVNRAIALDPRNIDAYERL